MSGELEVDIEGDASDPLEWEDAKITKMKGTDDPHQDR
jgi:hypothetical protein